MFDYDRFSNIGHLAESLLCENIHTACRMLVFPWCMSPPTAFFAEGKVYPQEHLALDAEDAKASPVKFYLTRHVFIVSQYIALTETC